MAEKTSGAGIRSRSGNLVPGVFSNMTTSDTFLASIGGTPIVRSVLDYLPCPIAIWGRDHLVALLNYQAMQLFGVPDYQFQESAWIDRIDPRDRNRFSAACRKLNNGSDIVCTDYRFLKKDGPNIWLRDASVSYRDGQGEIEAIVSTYTDISDLEHPLGGKKNWNPERLEGVLKPVIHEIRNNLHAIRMEIDLLLMDFGTAFASGRFFETMDRVNKSLQDLREYLVSPEPHPSAANPRLIVEEILCRMKQELESRGIAVKLALSKPVPLVWVDSSQFRSALERVVEFCRALLERGGELEIDAGLKSIDSAVHVEVTLTTCSVSSLEVDENDVFRPFLRVNNHQIGLGMALADQILRRNQGQITFFKENQRRGQISILLKPYSS